jgi:hypothetical protein
MDRRESDTVRTVNGSNELVPKLLKRCGMICEAGFETALAGLASRVAPPTGAPRRGNPEPQRFSRPISSGTMFCVESAEPGFDEWLCSGGGALLVGSVSASLRFAYVAKSASSIESRIWSVQDLNLFAKACV